MNTHFYSKYIFISCLIVVAFFGYVPFSYAAVIHVEQPKGVVRAGDTVFVKVYIDTQDREINAVEGTITLSGNARIEKVETGGSILSVWPVYPQFSDTEVHFVGGTPSGAFGNRLQLFSIAITPITTGTITVSASRVSVYLADGTGSLLTPTTIPASFTVTDANGTVRNEVNIFNAQDTVPPEKFNAEYGQDPTVYDGKPFVAFHTTDTGSGVARYEVIEDGVMTVVDTGVYVLHDEKNIRNLTITAIDSAGNKRSVVYNIATPRTIYPAILVVLLILIACVIYVFLKRKKKNVLTEI